VEPLRLLADTAGGPRWPLPEVLEQLYGGPLGFETPRLVANFVQSLDGVVAIPELERSNALIADESVADRFVMALLRACADVVLVGSGTLLASPQGTWRADRVYPPAAVELAELRAALGKPEHPAVAIVTSGASLDPTHPVLERAIVLTTERAAPEIDAAEVVAVSPGERVDLAVAVAALHERGHQLILCEGGPTVFGELLAQGLVDELFLTVSPVLAGRGPSPRLALIEGVELLPDAHVGGTLLSARRAGEHLLLRYALS
jgi:riboflavin biosynthesis pyrimidine reductase